MVDEPEAVNDHLTLHRLDGVNHHSYGARIQLLEALLGVDVLAATRAEELTLHVDSDEPTNT